MHAVRPSHIPSCDAIPAAGRRGARALLPVAAVILMLPLPAQAQEARARDLSIVEDVLIDTIQEAIQLTVRAINTENLEAQEAAGRNQEAVPIRYVFRSGGQTLARGMYLRDYGAIFTVQVPAVSYSHSAFMTYRGNVTVMPPGAPSSIEAVALGEELQLRAQISRMDGEIAVLRQRLESEVELNGADSESAQAVRTALASWERAFDETQRAYNDYLARKQSALSAGERPRAVSSAEAREIDPARRDDRFSGLRMMISATPEEIAAAEDLAQEQRNQIEGAVIDAVIGTLGRYGHVMHGMNDDERLAVVLLPSSYLSPMGSWARATQRDEEFIISVRFGDALALDRGTLPEEDFRQRVRIEPPPGQRREKP